MLQLTATSETRGIRAMRTGRALMHTIITVLVLASIARAGNPTSAAISPTRTLTLNLISPPSGAPPIFPGSFPDRVAGNCTVFDSSTGQFINAFVDPVTVQIPGMTIPFEVPTNDIGGGFDYQPICLRTGSWTVFVTCVARDPAHTTVVSDISFSCTCGPCDDGNPCTTDSCGDDLECVHTNVADTTPCNDGNACTTGDACVAGQCTGNPVNCDDGNVCTNDSCNPNTGACVHTNNTGPCSDGNACTTESCQGGTCTSGPPVNCNDGNVCTDDACNPATGCTHTNNTGPCSDGNACTTESCQGGTCTNGPPVNCNDGNVCTDDTCDPTSGCHNEPCNPPDCPIACQNPCGNGVLDPGETCDPPDPTINPTTGLPTCRGDCTFCGDGIPQPPETCDDGNDVQGCVIFEALDDCLNNCTKAICRDPSKIVFKEPHDRFDVHGSLTRIPDTDPTAKSFAISLTDLSGNVLFQATLPAGSLVANSRRTAFSFKNPLAKTAGGFAKVKLKVLGTRYRGTATVYGDLSAAIDHMITHVFIGSDEWTVTAHWQRQSNGWRFIQPE